MYVITLVEKSYWEGTVNYGLIEFRVLLNAQLQFKMADWRLIPSQPVPKSREALLRTSNSSKNWQLFAAKTVDPKLTLHT